MNRFKICPECHTKNPPTVSECEKCYCDLIGIPVSDDISNNEIHIINASPPKESLRICSDCGHNNPANARKCLKCGEDISDVLPTLSTDNNMKESLSCYRLISIDKKVEYNIPSESIIIGRDNELKNYLSSKKYVSRRHCCISIIEGSLYVEDLGSANSTYVNNKRINGKVKLRKGDEIGLGGAVFNGSRQEEAAYFLIG